MSLPLTARQLSTLRALHQSHPALGELVSAVALAFDASKTDNPQLARLILEQSCRRVAAGQPDSLEVLIKHLQHFGYLGCLSAAQVTRFSESISKLTLTTVTD
ncbi:hypothetical protein SFA35_25145 (plasmid) [Pseudomonas sp. HR96]|uniref:hypothetical protein n=1 Tax=Pseudomonas sp. HR96 TaxID=1027966 RepID=UPI002A7605FF|nr:hypothetical protein [Pseudomonas sp. HR96]WPP02456.1 hypothetical protein SFA35_25145 [Pseudomonas sp. HR96]